MEEAVLFHHGILGQKWGVRRYQNEDRRHRLKKIDKQPVEITVAGEFPGFQCGERRSAFLNLGLDVEIDGVTYHLISRFAEKAEMGEVIDTIELERSQRRTA